MGNPKTQTHNLIVVFTTVVNIVNTDTIPAFMMPQHEFHKKETTTEHGFLMDEREPEIRANL